MLIFLIDGHLGIVCVFVLLGLAGLVGSNFEGEVAFEGWYFEEVVELDRRRGHIEDSGWLDRKVGSMSVPHFKKESKEEPFHMSQHWQYKLLEADISPSTSQLSSRHFAASAA